MRRFLAALALLVFLPGAASALDVVLRWNDPNEPGVTDGYKVYYGTVKNGPYPNSIDVTVSSLQGKKPYAVVTGLSDSLRYYFVVKTYNEVGESTTASNQQTTSKWDWLSTSHGARRLP